ncbi:uncharacterized protein LOC135688709 isoform X2 [Rhopilema esculentum]
MASERRVGLLNRQTRLSRANSHYGVVANGQFPSRRQLETSISSCKPTVVVQSFVLPEKKHSKVKLGSVEAKEVCTVEMSVEESLQFFDNTVAALDRHPNKQNYESESDLISEFGYGSGYTELSATSDGEDHQAKQYGPGNRRRKSRQNRNQRLQNDPILGDLESDSTNDGQLFGSEMTPRVRTRTNSGQRRQRERRRQRRQNVSRNSWTDSGLSLSKTDSQRSSHSDMSPIKRGRSKTTTACVNQISEVCARNVREDAREETPQNKISSELAKASTDSGVSSPGPLLDSPVRRVDNCGEEVRVTRQAGDVPHEPASRKSDRKERNSQKISYEPPSHEAKEKPLASSSLVNSLDSSSKSLDKLMFDIKPTNWKGVVNGTYTPKEKEILHQVFQNAQNSSQVAEKSTSSPRDSKSSKFPLPAHLDYPFCMYRQDEKKAKKSNGLMKGLRKLKAGITNKRNSAASGSISCGENSPRSATDSEEMPPSRPVDKKKSLLKRIFKQSGESKARRSSAFRRDRYGSTRSFSGSVSQLFSRGNRARSQSVENLKNCIRRGRDSFMKRSNSSVSLNAKMTRSSSVSSLMGRRNGFTRQGSMVSIAGNYSRTNTASAFRRSDSVRSLHGGYDIATRVMQAREMHDSYYAREDDGLQMMSHQTDYNVPIRGGWRPASRISRREQDFYDASSYYDENEFHNCNDCYASEEPCPHWYDETYYDDSICYNDYYEPSFDHHHHDPNNIYYSRVTLANMDNRPVRQHLQRYPSYSSMYNPRGRPQSQISSYYSPANSRRDERMVIAPLSVQVTHERVAARRHLSTTVPVCDTMV